MVHFDFGPSAAYGSTTSDAAVAADGTASTIVGGLAPSSTYHFRAVAENSFGQAVGDDQVFSTPEGEKTGPTTHRPRKCKRGFVRRKGRCVRRRHHRHHRNKHRHVKRR
jgi:hypothetical protein